MEFSMLACRALAQGSQTSPGRVNYTALTHEFNNDLSASAVLPGGAWGRGYSTFFMRYPIASRRN